MESKIATKIVAILLVLSFLINIYFLIDKQKRHTDKQKKHDVQYSMNLGLTSQFYDSSTGTTDYIKAIQFASKASALSFFTSYAKEDNANVSYTETLLLYFEELEQKQIKLKKPEEISNTIREVAENPLNNQLWEKLMELVKTELDI
ncbi:hypothetical protein [Paenibacillus larvae]|uniref:hypothetical protein n=1 Tax=Paenibacillus larvae TaxID=1464 RepID=UPI00288E0B75|nr:hypothetical protein [Paenibacillus larvae]MDT2173103.1 hypothetical protein [Paenibacillus larvae]MDT2245953.1 hypothetical protein [Paenibacillus larvae]MDT2275177.1 hypothetical protein [Paenibacillus larvae]